MEFNFQQYLCIIRVNADIVGLRDNSASYVEEQAVRWYGTTRFASQIPHLHWAESAFITGYQMGAA